MHYSNQIKYFPISNHIITNIFSSPLQFNIRLQWHFFTSVGFFVIQFAPSYTTQFVSSQGKFSFVPNIQIVLANSRNNLISSIVSRKDFLTLLHEDVNLELLLVLQLNCIILREEVITAPIILSKEIIGQV